MDLSNFECVYFLWAEHTCFVKIGWTTDLPRRIAQFQTACPHRLVLIALRPGDKELESAYHRELSLRRTNGEWFSMEMEVRYWLSHSMKTLYPELWAVARLSIKEADADRPYTEIQHWEANHR